MLTLEAACYADMHNLAK